MRTILLATFLAAAMVLIVAPAAAAAPAAGAPISIAQMLDAIRANPQQVKSPRLPPGPCRSYSKRLRRCVAY